MINVINKYVKSLKLCEGEESCGVERKKDELEMDDICEYAVAGVEFSSIFY